MLMHYMAHIGVDPTVDVTADHREAAIRVAIPQVCSVVTPVLRSGASRRLPIT
jgi:hypothetical protein